MKSKLLVTAAALVITVSGAVTSSASTATTQLNSKSLTQTKRRIGMTKAREIATKRASGKIESSELERENGKLVYSFDIRNAKGTITEVQVEAYTGKIVSVKEENAATEAAEKKADEKAKRKN